jgi:hypothetical protein
MTLRVAVSKMEPDVAVIIEVPVPFVVAKAACADGSGELEETATSRNWPARVLLEQVSVKNFWEGAI